MTFNHGLEGTRRGTVAYQACLGGALLNPNLSPLVHVGF